MATLFQDPGCYTFLCRLFTLRSQGTARIFDELKNLCRHFVRMEQFNIFALFTRNWPTRLNFNLCSGFIICSCAKCIQNGVFQLSYHASMQPRLCRINAYGVYTTPVKFWTVPAKNLTLILAFKLLNGWASTFFYG